MSGRLAGSGREALLVLALAGAPLLAALAGAAGPLRIELNLGPGDGPYVRGFTPRHEVEDKVGTHWTTYHAELSLPLEVRGAALDLSYRFARVFPETAAVEVGFQGRPVDRFTCRGGRTQERHAGVGSPGGPLTVSFDVDSHERRNLGLKLDWVRLALGRGARARLSGGARWRAALTVALLLLLLRHAGWGRASAALLSAPWALAAAGGLLRDPWLTHRLLTGVPETLALAGLAGVGLGRFLLARGRIRAPDLAGVTALAATALLLRATALNHPAFYYPDLMTHARLVETLHEAGWDFLRSPASYVGLSGAWTKPAYGAISGLPYAVGFHVLFVLLPVGYDTLLTVEKLVAAAISTVPLVLVWALARRLGLSPLGALLMVAVPTYTSRLSFALLPALTGHAMDVAFLFWIAGHLEGLRAPRTFAAGAALLAAAQLSYVSCVTNLSLFLGVLAVLAAAQAQPGRLARGARILALGLAGSALAVLAYYRDFLGAAGGLLPRILGHGGGGSLYPVEGWLAFTWSRTRDFFGYLYPGLAAAGFALAWRRGRGRALLGAWLVTFLLLCLLRAKIPDVFRYGHETLFLAPWVCLTAGEALAALAGRGRAWRAAAGALLLFLLVQGLRLQWLAVADQLANAL